MKKQILSVENEVVLHLLQAELDKMGIKYSVTLNNSTPYPTNTKPYAFIISDESNRALIKELVDNIKEDTREVEESHVSLSNTKPWFIILKVVLCFVIIFIIICQQVMLNRYRKALTVTNQSYVYEWSCDLKSVKTYSKDKKYLLQIGYDNDRNNIFEKVETYLPTGAVILAEDINQNYFTEKQTVYLKNIKMSESYSSNDNGVFDKTIYYKNGIVSQVVDFSVERNEITIH
jgi:hypothetical protein